MSCDSYDTWRALYVTWACYLRVNIMRESPYDLGFICHVGISMMFKSYMSYGQFCIVYDLFMSSACKMCIISSLLLV